MGAATCLVPGAGARAEAAATGISGPRIGIMKLIHEFEEMTPEKRSQDPHMDGTGLTFATLEHGGECPDTMPQAIVLTDPEGRSCTYVPVTVDGQVVDSKGFSLVPDEATAEALDALGRETDDRN